MYFNVFVILLSMCATYSVAYSWYSFKTINVYGCLILYFVLLYEVLSIKYSMNKRFDRIEAACLYFVTKLGQSNLNQQNDMKDKKE